jgi:hypothetical protein
VEDVGQSRSDDGIVGSGGPSPAGFGLFHWWVGLGDGGTPPGAGDTSRALGAILAFALGAIRAALIRVEQLDRLE